jgi:beta-1,4-mannosyltransferase
MSVQMQVRIAEWFERSWGRLADKHLCVSNAMRAELKHGWHINATVFYDRAPSHFGPTPLKQQVIIFCDRPLLLHGYLC